MKVGIYIPNTAASGIGFKRKWINAVKLSHWVFTSIYFPKHQKRN